MKKQILILLIITLIFSINLNIKNRKSDFKKQCIEGNNRFAVELYLKLAEKKNEDIFFSPFSISNTLAMTYAGARKNTEKQMADVLHFILPQTDFHNVFSTIINDIDNKRDRKYILKIANALWGQKDYGFLSSFKKSIKQYYGGSFYELDFNKALEKSRKRINSWVEKRTENKIKELIHKNDLPNDTKLVLTNAIYFKGNWAEKFNKKETKKSLFYITAEKTKEVYMMYKKDRFNFYNGKNFKMLELPYESNKISMIIFLPSKELDINEFEKDLNYKNIKVWLHSMYKTKIRIYIPKFKLNTRYYFKKVFYKMGMKDAFTSKADFSGMTGNKMLKISKIIHQAYMDVNEEGTEAAASTAVIMRPKSIMPRREEIFKADHPFVFMIIHKKTNSILFLGKLVNPKD